jgi:hypothetical protein
MPSERIQTLYINLVCVKCDHVFPVCRSGKLLMKLKDYHFRMVHNDPNGAHYIALSSDVVIKGESLVNKNIR